MFDFKTIPIRTNDDWEFSLQWRDSAGVSRSFSGEGWTVGKMHIRLEGCACNLTEDGDYIDPPALALSTPPGFGIRLDSDATPGRITLSIRRFSLAPGIYRFDVLLENADDSDRWVFGRGYIDMSGGVTG